ncbi:hypothetical protein ACFYPA_34855 [Streptomyces sp. NPDC005775]|uniref:hypothetical protein n=1 Tax=Streptomyces sp. NPDC005775 TaxID=3364729 RepID=UPI0036B64206
MATHLELFADYFQIHILDEGSGGDFSGVRTEQTVVDGLGVIDDALAIGTAVNDTVTVSVHVLADQPYDASDGFDHVVEASLHAPSGRLIVMGCDWPAPDHPLGHAEVKAVNELLWERRSQGLPDVAAALRELRASVEFPWTVSLP